MKAINSIAVLSAIVSVSSAASTVDIAFISVDPTALALSAITTVPSATVYAVGCAHESNGRLKNDSCPFTGAPYPTITIGSSRFDFVAEAGPQETDSYMCAVSSTTEAQCSTVIVEEVSAGVFSTMTTTDTSPVTLTYGAATLTSSLSGLSGSSATTTGTSSGVGGASAASSSSSSSSTGAAARETGAMGLLAVAGVAGVGILL